MKRAILIFLATLTILTLVACSQSISCPPGPETQGKDDPNVSEAILTAKVIDINGSSILLANMAEDAGPADIYRIGGDGIEVIAEDGTQLGIEALEQGMLVDVAFDGRVQESFPMGLGGIKGVHIKGRGDDITGLYRRVIDDLYKVDPGLNSNISILAFDFTKVSNLTEAEKAALLHLLRETYSEEIMAATYAELSEQGYIDKDKLYFEKGLLFNIEDTTMSGDEFTFNAGKWRSGLGAYFFHECTAIKSEGAWTYTIGAEMIS
ncbi:MAG: hypothetical protein AAGU12_08140 [Clostridiales bacterium]